MRRCKQLGVLLKKKRIVIAEDHSILRHALRIILSCDCGIEVVGEAGDGLEAIDSVRHLNPDLVLLDLAMPGMSGVEAIRQIKTLHPDTKVLVLTVHKSENFILESLKNGADGYLSKEITHEELMIAINEVVSGKRYLGTGISEKVTPGYHEGARRRKLSSPLGTLTQRERQILMMIAKDYKNKDIARSLGISEKTIEKHRSNLMRKLDLHSAAALTAFAISEGLMDGCTGCEPLASNIDDQLRAADSHATG